VIRILILDDDKIKTERIIEIIRAIPEISADDVFVAQDLIQARDACHKNLYDLLVLDLRLPNRIGDAPQGMAGCEFIKELNTSTTLLRPYHIIGLTAYEDILGKVASFFEDELWRVIKYDAGTNNWRRQLSSKLQYLVTSKKALLKSDETRHIYDLGIVTALHVPEFQCILDLPADWEVIKQPNDPTIYQRGRFRNGEKQLSIVAACAQQKGMPAAAVLTSKLITQFRPRYLAMSGIAAAVKGGDAKMGDILIADQSWDYESGKHKIVGDKQVFEPDPRSIPLRVDVKEWLLHLQAQNSFLADIQNGWRGAKQKGKLQVHIGPIASGAAVVQDEGIIAHIKTHNRKLIGLDMETYGVFFAAENSSLPRPIAMSIKSACDFADAGKSDEHQAYAAFTSAQYLYRFALQYLK
jgi:nucleoside phosphorylase/CheY-like chemotaxis protein